jgi:hypothetical protein
LIFYGPLIDHMSYRIHQEETEYARMEEDTKRRG